MASLYPGTSISGYNSNPPPDDGTTVSTNLVTWAGIKTKLGDPLDTAIVAMDSNITAAFGKTIDGAGVVTTAVNYAMTAADQGRLIYVTVSGKSITTPDAGTVNAPFVFGVLNNSSGNISLLPNATNSQELDGGTGGATIPAGAGCLVKTDGTNWWTYGQNWSTTQVTPQGRLTVVSGTPVISADETGQTSVYYTPYVGNLIPIPNGTKFSTYTFAELTLALVSSHVADALYDVFVFLDPSDGVTVRVGTGPAWTTPTAGSSARGTGASTTQLSRLSGLWTNTVAATMRNGSSTYSVAAESATYVGTIYIDHTAGNVSCHVSFDQNRKFGVWNAYNRVPIILRVGDGTSSWGYATATVRASNNVPSSYSATEFNVGSGTTSNGMVVLSGLAEEYCDVIFDQYFLNGNTSGNMVTSSGIGWNSTTAYSGTASTFSVTPHNGGNGNAKYAALPFIGINNVCALEDGSGNGGDICTFNGTQPNMLLQAQWRG